MGNVTQGGIVQGFAVRAATALVTFRGDDLNVIPIAAWRPVRSRRWGMKATVTSPCSPPGTVGGKGRRVTA